MTVRDFADRIMKEEFRFPFSAIFLADHPTVENPKFPEGLDLRDRDGKVVDHFDTPNELHLFIQATMKVLDLHRDVRHRHN